MHVHRYRYNYAEEWLDSARDQVLYSVERLTESGGLSRFEYYRIAAGVKLRCLAASAIAFAHLIMNWIHALWASASRYLLHKSTIEQTEEAWDEVQESIDVLMNALTGIFDSDAVLTTVDRGNIRRICELGRKMHDVISHPDITPETRREIEAWYKNAKIYVREGGDGAQRELKALSDALEQIRIAPTMAPENLMSWRWEKGYTGSGSVAVEKIRGIRWKPAAIPLVTGPKLSKRVWTKKTH